MKKIFAMLGIGLLMTGSVLAQSEAGAVWLLINPGARYSGMGEVGVAMTDDAYASYWNPAALGFLRGREAALTHTNWLPNLVNDIYYEFLGYRQFVKDVGTLGGNVILMNLGEQTRTDEYGNELGTFNSYMLAITGSYGTALSRRSSLGISIKMVHQHLTDQGAGKEKGKGYSTNFCFDVAYLKHQFLTKNLTLGVNFANIGPKIAFIDVNQADPMPTNMKAGLAYTLDGEYNKLTISYDVNKVLVSAYPNRDIDGDERVGGYDENGHKVSGGEYNKDGQREYAHSDEWYTGIFTSWIDDWLLIYDSENDGIGKDVGGGLNQYGEKADTDGNTNDGSLGAEFKKLTHNFGIEYWYSDLFAIRVGGIYDKTGNITMKNGKWPVPTFGAGLRWAGMGFDFGYTAGEPGHPRQNTMLFSMNIKF